MNGRRSKAIRKLAKFKVGKKSEDRTYVPLQSQDYMGNPFNVPGTKVSTGTRCDYLILKDYFQGKDVIMPNHLRSIIDV